jgi:xanthine dehydrogenase YagS FAD-binding subunit
MLSREEDVMRNFEYVKAPTTARAVELLGERGGDPALRPRIIAGGTDLLDEMKEGIIAPSRLIRIQPSRDLRSIRIQEDGGLRIGALATLGELERSSELGDMYPGIAAAVRTIASPQIRNMATVGGNLCQRPRCWYYRDQALHCARKGGPVCYAVSGESTYHAILGGHQCYIVHPSDLAPALSAHGARITYTGPEGRRSSELDSFFIGPDQDILRENVLNPGEVVEEITLPAPRAGDRGVYLKVRDRSAWDFATLSVAALLEMDGGVCRRAKIVLGAVAPIPWPAPAGGKVIAGKRITARLAQRAAEAALKGASPLEHNAYKVPLAKNLVRRAILEAAGVET